MIPRPMTEFICEQELVNRMRTTSGLLATSGAICKTPIETISYTSTSRHILDFKDSVLTVYISAGLKSTVLYEIKIKI